MLILLDIDGVMVLAAGWKKPDLLNDGFSVFSAKAVQSLNKIIKATNASVVLTSTHKSRYSVSIWKQIFAKRGIRVKISRLEMVNEFQSRKDEILNWIQLNNQEKNFVIIDDDKSLNDLPVIIKSRLILTSPLIGLNDELADKAIEILHRPLLAHV